MLGWVVVGEVARGLIKQEVCNVGFSRFILHRTRDGWIVWRCGVLVVCCHAVVILRITAQSPLPEDLISLLKVSILWQMRSSAVHRQHRQPG